MLRLGRTKALAWVRPCRAGPILATGVEPGSDPIAPGGPFLRLQSLSLAQTQSLRSFPLFDRAAGFPPPRSRNAQAVARRRLKGWPRFSGHPKKGLALTRPSTMA